MSNVLDFLVKDGPAAYYDESFRNLIEEHLNLLINDKSTEKIQINSHLSYKFENNLYGLLNELKYPRHLHWIIMRVNNLHKPSDYKSFYMEILIPNINFIDSLMKVNITKESSL